MVAAESIDAVRSVLQVHQGSWGMPSRAVSAVELLLPQEGEVWGCCSMLWAPGPPLQ
jgi:hypothetical protein